MSALEDLAEALLRVERGHVDVTNPLEGPWLACSCGWVMDPAPQGAYREVRMRYHRAEALAAFVRAREAEAVPRRFAEHLVHDSLGVRCELTSFVDSSRCSGKAVAIRWEAGFADPVCQEHAETAVKRGAVVVFAKHHDGTEGS